MNTSCMRETMAPMAYLNFMNQQRAMVTSRAMKMSHVTPTPKRAAKDVAAMRDPAMMMRHEPLVLEAARDVDRHHEHGIEDGVEGLFPQLLSDLRSHHLHLPDVHLFSEFRRSRPFCALSPRPAVWISGFVSLIRYSKARLLAEFLNDAVLELRADFRASLISEGGCFFSSLT